VQPIEPIEMNGRRRHEGEFGRLTVLLIGITYRSDRGNQFD
jgi:hypothetical protein